MGLGHPPESLRLVRERLDSSLTPWEALRALAGDRRPFALTGAWAGSAAVLGSEPTLVARGAPFSALASMPDVEGAVEGAVGGGWFGWLGYGAARYAERSVPPPPRPVPLGDASLAWYDHVLRLDRDGVWWFEALWEPSSADRLAARLGVLRSRMAAQAPRPEPFSVGPFSSRPEAAGHAAAVRRCVEYIEAGDLYQANLTMRLSAAFSGSPLSLFSAAAAALQPRFAAYVGDPASAVASLSPELFLRRVGRSVSSAPIKGTAPRLGSEADDARARDALVASAKDRAENVMILDLMRNDLGRVSEYGSVRVVDVARPEAHAGVWHLVSEVAGTLRDGVDDAELLRATFPPGSVTGAPKVKALEVISTLESTGREVYTGAIGYASPVAGLELNVAIRTFEIARDRVWLGVGGGVVADSVPEREVEESLVKARPLLAAIGAAAPPRASQGVPDAVPAPTRHPRPDPARGVFTTFAARDGVAVDLDAHAARLTRSVATLFAVELDPDDLLVRMQAAAAGTAGLSRVRVDVTPDGEIAVTTSARRTADEAPHEPVRLVPLVVPGGLGEHKWSDRSLIDHHDPGDGAESLIVDLDGTALETSRGNLWIVEAGRVVTPVLDGRQLPGVTGATLDAAEEPIDLARIAAADEVFVTGSIRVVQPAYLDGTPRPAGPRPVTLATARLLLQHRAAAGATSRTTA